MKKLFTLIAGMLLVGSVNAAVLVDEVVAGASYNYSGGWNGNWFNQGTDVNKDVSEYDYVWIQYASTTGKVKFGIVYSEWQKTESWGEVYAEASKVIETESGVVGIALEKTKTYLYDVNNADNPYKGDIYAKHVRQVYLQDQGVPSTITVVGIWYGSEAEYQEALAGNAPVVAAKKDLTLADLGTGWGGSTYDAATKTVTIGEDWSGKGWWLENWDNDLQANVGADYSDYDKLAIEFATPTAMNGKVVVEYEGGAESTSYEFDAGATVAVVDLNPEGKKLVKQAYIQGPADAQYVLAAAYMCTNEVAPEIPADPNADAVIWSGTHRFDTWDNFMIEASKFADVAAENQLVFTISEAFDVASMGWTYGGQVLVKKSDWSEDWAVNSTTDNPAVAAGTTNTEVVFPMGLADGAMLADVKANGMIVQGMGLTVTKVSIRKAGDTGVAAPKADTGNGAIYNLAGQKVDKSFKGVVIIDGKKYLNK